MMGRLAAVFFNRLPCARGRRRTLSLGCRMGTRQAAQGRIFQAAYGKAKGQQIERNRGGPRVNGGEQVNRQGVHASINAGACKSPR